MIFKKSRKCFVELAFMEKNDNSSRKDILSSVEIYERNYFFLNAVSWEQKYSPK